MSKGQSVTLSQLAKSVEHSDLFNLDLSSGHLAHVLEIALKVKVGIACLGQRTLDIDLGNGSALRCTVVEDKTEVAPAVVLDPELVERIRVYDDQVHDMDTSEGMSFLVNHFLAIGLKQAENERDSQTEELF